MIPALSWEGWSHQGGDQGSFPWPTGLWLWVRLLCELQEAPTAVFKHHTGLKEETKLLKASPVLLGWSVVFKVPAHPLQMLLWCCEGEPMSWSRTEPPVQSGGLGKAKPLWPGCSSEGEPLLTDPGVDSFKLLS